MEYLQRNIPFVLLIHHILIYMLKIDIFSAYPQHENCNQLKETHPTVWKYKFTMTKCRPLIWMIFIMDIKANTTIVTILYGFNDFQLTSVTSFTIRIKKCH